MCCGRCILDILQAMPTCASFNTESAVFRFWLICEQISRIVKCEDSADEDPEALDVLQNAVATINLASLSEPGICVVEGVFSIYYK